MALIGRAIARLARSVGGQLLLELPDDMSPAFVSKILSGANFDTSLDLPYALFVSGRRQDSASVQPKVDFRELAMYRQGHRLAVALASDNRGMSTYTSVYPLLFPNCFPASPEFGSAGGVAGLHDFSLALSQEILRAVGGFGLHASEFHSAVREILEFLAGAYEVAGSGQSSSAADWWLHVDQWVESLVADAGSTSQSNGVSLLYGCAGLPVPAKGVKLVMTPKDYLGILQSRWSTPAGIIAELGRLQGMPSASEAARKLADLDWERAYSIASVRSDSPIAIFALGHDGQARQKSLAWSLLKEDDFQDSYVEAKGRLRLLRSGCDLPTPWKGALPLLVVNSDEVVDSDAAHVVLAEVELVIPYRLNNGAADVAAHAGRLIDSITIAGTRGSSASFLKGTAAEEQKDDGLHIKGSLTLISPKKARNLGWVEAVAIGAAAGIVVDRCDLSFTVVMPDEVALWARPQGVGAKSALRGPCIWREQDNDAVSLELNKSGVYDFALAWGEQSHFSREAAVIAESKLCLDWAGVDDCGAKGVVEITESAEVKSDANTLFYVNLTATEKRPISPVIAAAHGLHPDTSKQVDEEAFDFFERIFGEVLESKAEQIALGSILVTSTPNRSGLVEKTAGVYCTADIGARIGTDIAPGFPSPELIALPEYIALTAAYRSLGIPEVLARTEERERSGGLTISRINLDFLSSESIEDLLGAYRQLINASSALGLDDRFWAFNPFSLVVFKDEPGFQSPQAVFLSPLHPLRLAWIWSLHVGLREAHEDGASPAKSLGLMDGTNIPSFVRVPNNFGENSVLFPIAVDCRPSDLYLGWHASTALNNGRASVPEWIAGYRFPVDGLSSLSSVSVGAAIDDFMRVSPHVQHLEIGLSGATSARRSASIDDGVLSKLRELAIGSDELDGIGGVKVVDSEVRLGPIPLLSSIGDSLSVARPGFNVEWVVATSGGEPHITFLEGTAALVEMKAVRTPGEAWLARLPLRRTPVRSRSDHRMLLNYSLAEPADDASGFYRALFSYEAVDNGSYAIMVVPNPSSMARHSNWLVTGDFGVDPEALSRAAAKQSGGDYLLWDWRPAAATKATRDSSNRAQPFVVLASVPPALSSAIRKRLLMLNESLQNDAVESRTRMLISTLSERAVGLNTLLAIGHHQATGALGFYFALRSLSVWATASPDNELRLIIPVDAVDSFLRDSFSQGSDGSRKRADLLCVRVFFDGMGVTRVILAPVEIKHYGLSSGEVEQEFPVAGEPRLNEHVNQLSSYQEQLQLLCQAYGAAAGRHASLLGQRLVAVLEAAMQLSPKVTSVAGSFLCAVANGEAEVELGKGVLLWYQARSKTIDGVRAVEEEVYGSAATSRIEVRVDPAAFDECFWSGAAGLPHQVVCAALVKATVWETPSSGLSGGGGLFHGELGSSSNAQVADNGTEDLNVASECSGAVSGSDSSPGSGEMFNLFSVSASVGSVDRGSVRKVLSPATLDGRYATILSALSEFNVRVDRPRGQIPYQEGPAFVEFAVSPSYGVSVSRIESQLDNLKLRLRLPADAEIGCSTHMGNVLLTVPKVDDERYFVDADELWSRWSRPETGFVVPVGEDASGGIVEIDFSNSNSPHLLVAGVTGSGKSEALLTILYGAARFYSSDELRLRLIDPKQTELNSLAELPHTDGPIGWTDDDAIALLDQAVEEMERRYEAFRLSGVGIRQISEYQSSVGPMPRWVIVLDEYADLVSDDSKRKVIERYLQRLSQKARAAGIHVIVSTQKPVVQVVNTVVKGNLPGRIALRVNTAIESRVILDETGAEKLRGKGDALVRTGNSAVRVQFARYSL